MKKTLQICSGPTIAFNHGKSCTFLFPTGRTCQAVGHTNEGHTDYAHRQGIGPNLISNDKGISFPTLNRIAIV